MGENEYITRKEFDQYKREIDGKFEKVYSENQQVLIELAKIGERIGNFNEKFLDIKTSIDGKLDSFKDNIEDMQNEFRNNLKEPRDRINTLKWSIVTAISTGLVGTMMALILKS